jgi:hypothetical protein
MNNPVRPNTTVWSGAFALVLAWVALTAQTKPVQLPPQALNQLAKPPVATVEARPNPAVVNSPVDLQVTIMPAVNGPLQYEVYVNNARLTQCPTNSPVCQWTASAPGDYAFHAIVHRLAVGRGGRGAPALTIVGPRSILKVQAPPVETPTQTPTVPDKIPENVAPLPELTVKLLSPKVVAGESATFSVSLVNASPLEYVIDMGDGTTLTKTDAEFTYTYAQPGMANIVASYPVSSPIVRSNLDVTIEPAPPPPVTLQLRAVPDHVRTGESITFQVSIADGRPITVYSFDPNDGSTPRTFTSDTFVASYSRPGQYLAAVSPAGGQAGMPATALIVVSRVFPWIWIYIVVGIVGVAVVVWVITRPPPTPPTSPPHAPAVVPAATFHPHPDDALRFEPSKGKGIALEVHYVPNVASLSYTPRVRIREEHS